MSPLIKDLIVQGLLAGTAVKKAKKTSANMAGYALAGVVALIGFVFLSFSGYQALLDYYPPSIASAMVGCVILLLSLGIVLLVHYGANKKKAKKPSFDGDGLEGKIKGMLQNFEEPIRDNPKMALIAAALAGFAAGDHLGDKN